MISSPSRAEGFLAKRARLKHIARRFDVSLLTKGYIVGKLATDPAYHAVLEHLGRSGRPILDVGCGLGLLAHYLREHGSPAPVHGCDFDARKIALARAAARRADLPAVSFETCDVDALPDQPADIVLLDVLHYLAPHVQQRLLATLAARARRGDTVLIRATPRNRTWRHRVTLVQETCTRLTRWIPSDSSFNFPDAREITRPFEEAGCECIARPLWGRTPFNSHLFVARYAE